MDKNRIGHLCIIIRVHSQLAMMSSCICFSTPVDKEFDMANERDKGCGRSDKAREECFVIITSLRNRVYLDFNLCQEKVHPIAFSAKRTE